MAKEMLHEPTGEIRIVGKRREICEWYPEKLADQQVIQSPESGLLWVATEGRMNQMREI